VAQHGKHNKGNGSGMVAAPGGVERSLWGGGGQRGAFGDHCSSLLDVPLPPFASCCMFHSIAPCQCHCHHWTPPPRLRKIAKLSRLQVAGRARVRIVLESGGLWCRCRER